MAMLDCRLLLSGAPKAVRLTLEITGATRLYRAASGGLMG